MDSNQKKSKQYVDVDRLSDLPDPILCKILSYLPTKNAIATQILSTKWKNNNVSPFLDSPITLNLDDSLLLNPSTVNKSKKPSISFTNFVDKLFNQTLADVSSVEALKLKCHKYYGAKVVNWIHTVLRLNVRELVVRVRLDNSHELFNCLNGCKMLTRLELGVRFKVWIPEVFELPSLKVLVLFKLKFGKVGESFNDLIDGCPVLEDLCINNCTFPILGRIYIESTTLKILTIKDSWMDWPMCELQADLPNLQVLMYDDRVAGNYFLSNLNSLRFAHIDLGLSEQERDEVDGDSLTEENGFWYANGAGMVVAACSSTLSLFLSTQTVSALQCSHEQLPTFQNLTSLALGCIPSDGWALFARLLCNAPKLKNLTLEEGFVKNEGGYSSFLSVVPEPPFCLEFHIKEIEFKVFKEDENEIKLVEYFMNNGKVIHKLQLHCMPWKKTSIMSRLRMIATYSKINFECR